MTGAKAPHELDTGHQARIFFAALFAFLIGALVAVSLLLALAWTADLPMESLVFPLVAMSALPAVFLAWLVAPRGPEGRREGIGFPLLITEGASLLLGGALQVISWIVPFTPEVAVVSLVTAGAIVAYLIMRVLGGLLRDSWSRAVAQAP